jgi:hypothetical protein
VTKPRIFIASSVESLPIAEAANVNLDHEFEVSLWRTGAFKLSSTAVDDLATKASSVDFALFVFSPEDLSFIRDKAEHVARDNVVFELGLFIGSIGKERCFILKPRDEEMHLPSDLSGVNFADFDPLRTDKDMESATGAACIAIRKRSAELGVVSHTTLPKSVRLKSNPPNYKLVAADHEFLSACLESHTSLPDGLRFHFISNSIRSIPDKLLRVAAVKLERMNFIEKSVQTDEDDGYDYFSYSITEQGIDELLEHTDKLSVKPEVKFDDDIPF